MNESIREVQRYNEVIKTNVSDRGDTVEFQFTFAQPTSKQETRELWNNTESVVRKTVLGKLGEKGWISADGLKAFVPMMSTGQHSEDRKIWRLLYHRENPDTPATKH
jgi:hypothetical protein